MISTIPKDWKIVSIGDITIDHKQGFYTAENYSDNGVKLVRITDLLNPKISYSTMPFINISKDIFQQFRVDVGDFLIARSGAIGRYGIVTKDIPCVFASYIIRFKFDSNKADNNYIGLLFESAEIKRQLFQFTQGATNKNINAENIKKIKISLPLNIQEQKAITSIFSTVDDALQKSNEIITKTEKLKNGFLNKFFKDNIMDVRLVNLDSVFDVKNGTTPSTKNKQYWDNPTINWITPADLGKLDGKVTIEESERKISEIALNEINLTLMPKQSIVMSTRAPVGYVVVITKESTFNQGCKGLIPKDIDKVNPYYYCYYLSSKTYMLQNKAGQSTFKELSTKLLSQFEVPEIDIIKQNKITEILLTIDDRIALEKKRTEKLETIKKGLMNDLLTGKKRVRGFENV